MTGPDPDRPNLGARAGTPLGPGPGDGESPVWSDGIAKTVGWIVGGFSLLGASVGAVSLIPRIVGEYQDQVIAALILMLAAFVMAGSAAAINLWVRQGSSETFLRRLPQWWSRVMFGFLGAGCLFVIVSIGIILTLEAFVLGRAPVARLAISISENTDPGHGGAPTDTVKVQYRADGLSPNTFIVVDVMGLSVTDLDQAISEQRGERIYQALIGSDSTGKAESDIELQIPSPRYSVVVAESFPDKEHPASRDHRWRDELFGPSQLCADIGTDRPRACGWARVPEVPLPK
jgi:hypothetical protein